MSCPFVCVIIPTFGRYELLLRCVESIVQNNYPNFEILVIDQEEGGPLRDLLQDKFAGLPVRHFLIARAGAAKARNFGMTHTTSDIVAFIDDDAVASPEWLFAIGEAFTTLDPPPAIVAGRIHPIWPDKGRPRWYPEPREYLLGLYDNGESICLLPEHDEPISANMAGRRCVVLDLGGFDEHLGFNVYRNNPMLAGEDALLGQRAKKAGYGVYYHPRVLVRHQISPRKLTRRYFLKRNFWEGITIVEQHYHLHGKPLEAWPHVRWHAREIAHAAARFILPGYHGDYSLSHPGIRMLALARIGYSMGVIRGVLSQKEQRKSSKKQCASA